MPSQRTASAVSRIVEPIRPRLVGATVIVLGATELTPAAPHLFALLLALALAPREAWTRRSLQELLFEPDEAARAAHRLRQLLYRLRGFGLELEETPSGVISVRNPIADPLDEPEALADPDPGGDTARAPAVVLPLYAPRLPGAFLDWLDRQRDELQGRLTARHAGALRSARERQDWPAMLRIGRSLQALAPLDEEWTQAVAEAQAMLGRRDDALDTIDRFVRESEAELASWPALKRLRARVTATRLPKREGTLRGRGECLAFLADQWEQACAGGGARACTITGAPGMGKTRVGEEFAARARLEGAQTLLYRCDDQARHIPLSLFTCVVPQLRQRRGSIGADPSLAGALDRITHAATDVNFGDTTLQERREEQKRAIVDLLDAVSVEQPLLLIIDDAHLLDDASQAVIKFMIATHNALHLLVLLLSRPRKGEGSIYGLLPRFSAYTLPRLSDDESRALMYEQVTHDRLTDAHVAWAVAHAAGNPFYITALARHPCDSISVPVHIRSLAQSHYSSLTPEARTILDASLLLDSAATPTRVVIATGLPDSTFMAALRDLEDADLLRCEDGVYRGPHAILCEALEQLVPTTTRPVLHRRIATILSSESKSAGLPLAIRWAAVRHWLQAGEPATAVALALELAGDAALLGEPEAGAILLAQLAKHSIPLLCHRAVLDRLITLSEASHSWELLSASLKERTALAIAANEGPSSVADLALRSMTIAQVAGQALRASTIESIAADHRVQPLVRVRALARLLVVADLRLDRCAAENSFARLADVEFRSLKESHEVLRAHLIYHTTFGTVGTALALIGQLRSAFGSPSTDHECHKARNYCIAGLLKLGAYSDCAHLACEEWAYMSEHGHLYNAEYAGALGVEAFLNSGDVASAQRLFDSLTAARRQRPYAEECQLPVYYSSAVLLALHTQDFESAAALLPKLSDARQTPRLRAFKLAMAMRLRQLTGKRPSHSQFSELQRLYRCGSDLGGVDISVEALWHYLTREGNTVQASDFLISYLKCRREIGPPEAALYSTTAADPAWISYGYGKPQALASNRAYLSHY